MVARGGVHGCWGAWLWGGCAWLLGGVCMVARGCAWLWGVCVVAGVVHGCGGGVHRIQQDTVNEQALRILLECILVELLVLSADLPLKHIYKSNRYHLKAEQGGHTPAKIKFPVFSLSFPCAR